MSTRSSIWYGMDEKAPGSSLHTERGESWIHLYWELAEREPVATAAPIYLHIEGYGKRSHDSHAQGNRAANSRCLGSRSGRMGSPVKVAVRGS
jgi:hypothetical protein